MMERGRIPAAHRRDLEWGKAERMFVCFGGILDLEMDGGERRNEIVLASGKGVLQINSKIIGHC